MDYFATHWENFQLYGCGNLVCHENFLHNKRTLGCNVLIFVLEGILDISVGNSDFQVKTGEILFLPKNVAHHGNAPSKGRLSYFWVHFDGDFEKISQADFSKNYAFVIGQNSKVANFKRISLLFSQLIDISQREKNYRNDISQTALKLLMMEISQDVFDLKNAENTPHSPKISAIEKYIKDNCQGDVSMEKIAKNFCYSPQYISALFKKSTGTTINRYANKCRLELSKGLLCDSIMSVKEIAYTCGFSDEKYFMRLFKTSEGVTPMEYRNAFGQKFINSQKN